MDKQLLVAKLQSLGIKVIGDKIKKTDVEKILSAYKVQADGWEESNLVDLGIAPHSKNDQSEPVMYKETSLMLVVGVDEQSKTYRYDIYAGNESLGESSGFSSAEEAMRAAEREISFSKV